MGAGRMKKFFVIIFVLIFIENNAYADKDRWDDDKSNWSELMLAIYHRNNRSVKQLINDNADLLFDESNGSFYLNAVEVAIYAGNEIALQELLQTGKIIDLNRCLNLACNFNNIQIIILLCEFGADVNYIDERGYNSIMYAASFSTIEVMNFLIKQNVDVNLGRRPVDGFTALMLAAHNLNIEKLMILLQAGANKETRNGNGERAYDIAESSSRRINKKQRDNILELLR
jgi:ankyrin repeat protein